MVRRCDLVRGFVVLKKVDGFYRVVIEKGRCSRNCTLCKKCLERDIIRVVDDNEVSDWNRYVVRHMERTGSLCRAILDDDNLYQAALLHDVGKLGISGRILFKKGSLNHYEWEQIKKHPVMGSRFLMKNGFDDKIVRAVLCHHERFDGSGYPEGIKGLDIDLFARVISVADAFDSMVNMRPYRKPRSFEKAVNELIKGIGKQFDPGIVEALLSKIREERVCSK